MASSRWLFVVVGALAALALIPSCGNVTIPGGGGGGGTSTDDILDQLPDLSPPKFPDMPAGVGAISARITGPDGSTVTAKAAAGPTATIGSTTVEADSDGFVTFQGLTAPQQNVLVGFHCPGYVDNYRQADVVAGEEVFLDVHLAPVGTTQTISTDVDNTVADEGGSVLLPANSIVDASGNPVSQAVVGVTVVSPADPSFADVFPGAFAGNQASDGADAPLQSMGIIDVTLTDAAGNPLKLANGAVATITLPIDPATDPGTDTEPLWYFDKTLKTWVEQATWVEEGSGETRGNLRRDEGFNVYRGEVKHFSTWNGDHIYTPCYTDITVVDQDGNPLGGVQVHVDSPGNSNTGTTESDGTTGAGRVPPETPIEVWGEKSGVTSEIENLTTTTAGETITDTITLNLCYIRAKVVTEEGNPVAGARVTVQGTGWQTDFGTNSLGGGQGVVRPNEDVTISARKYDLTSASVTTSTPPNGETKDVLITLGSTHVPPSIPIYPFPPGIVGTWRLQSIGQSSALMIPVPIEVLMVISATGTVTITGPLVPETYGGQLLMTEKKETAEGTEYNMKPFANGDNYLSYLLSKDGQTLTESVKDGQTGASIVVAQFSRQS